MSVFSEKYGAVFQRLSTTNVSDALDALGLKGSTYGIRPLWHGFTKIAGPAVTLKMTAAGLTRGKHHLGVKAIDAAREGDVIIIDNGGRLDASCWGGILANGAKIKKIAGVVIDGACRDLDDCVECGFNVYARGTVVATARGRVMEEATNVMIQFGGVQVRPGDIVFGDKSGVVVVPLERLDDVVRKAESLYEKEEAMIADIKSGMSMIEVDEKYNYEKMLKCESKGNNTAS
jgi:regulator of RNase E activity RraA